MKRKHVPNVLLERDPDRWRSLPRMLKAALEAGTETIARQRKAIAAHAQVRSMPLVRVRDVVWMNPQRTATIEGCAGFLRVGEFEWPAVHLAATVALCANDKVIRGVLVHEFAHCFEFITRVVLASDSGQTTIALPETNDLFTDREHEESILVEPSDWFGPDDAEGFFRWGEPQLRVIHERMIELNVTEYLPIETPHFEFSTDTINLDDDVIDHVRLLARRRSRA